MTGNISGITTARALKFCVILCLELTTSLCKFGVCATHSLEMLKVRKTVKFDLSSWLVISRTARATAFKFCLILCVDLTTIFPKFGVYATHTLEMLKVRKIVKI